VKVFGLEIKRENVCEERSQGVGDFFNGIGAQVSG
jgi:hypothetical protein